MNKERLDAIANREAHCKTFGASVTLSVDERDELVALARDGLDLAKDSREALGFVAAAEQDYADANLQMAEEILAIALVPFDVWDDNNRSD
ncbi:hypothetical protein ACOTI8_29595 [Achromobacter xylosoxidans]